MDRLVATLLAANVYHAETYLSRVQVGEFHPMRNELPGICCERVRQSAPGIDTSDNIDRAGLDFGPVMTMARPRAGGAGRGQGPPSVPGAVVSLHLFAAPTDQGRGEPLAAGIQLSPARRCPSGVAAVCLSEEAPLDTDPAPPLENGRRCERGPFFSPGCRAALPPRRSRGPHPLAVLQRSRRVVAVADQQARVARPTSSWTAVP